MPARIKNAQAQTKELVFHSPGKAEKVSDHIIEQIRDAILSGRYKPGDRLASEKELVDGFGVSKASVREALRVLEVMGLIEIKKGTSGGVFIAEVDMKTTLHSIMNFLHFTSVSVKDITMLRYLLEPAVARLAAARITPEDIAKLEQMINENEDDPLNEHTREIGFHRYLARLSQNPILILIMDFIDNILRDVKAQLGLKAEFYDKVQKMHREILDCLIRKDGEAAARSITYDLLEVGDHLAEASGTPGFDPATLEKAQAGPKIPDTSGRMADMDLSDIVGPVAFEEIRNRGLVFRKVSSGELYMFIPTADADRDEKE